MKANRERLAILVREAMRNWLIGVVGVAAGLAALCGTSRAADAGCSLATLTGAYAFGVTTYNNPTPRPILVVAGIKFFDGRGNFTQRDYQGGSSPAEFAPPGTESGTYTVNPDCTGSLEIHLTAPPVCPGQDGDIKALFVISNGGRHVHEVVSAFIPPCSGGIAQNMPQAVADDWKVAAEENEQ